MSTLDTVKAQLTDLRDRARAKIGSSTASLTQAVEVLIGGYGTGGGVRQTVYEPLGNETHKVIVKCGDCGGVISQTTEACTDDDADHLCDICGGVVACKHEHTEVYYVASETNPGGTHLVKTACGDCGLVISTTTEECDKSGENGGCSKCGAIVEHCYHFNQETVYESNGDGTHIAKSICSNCGYIHKENLASVCSDDDTDGLCDKCGAQMDIPTASGSCGDELNWAFYESTGELKISGSGAMTEFANSNGAPWAAYRSDITQVVMSSEVTTIGKYAFYGLTSIKHLTVPDRVTAIGASAFKGCTGLITVVIGDGVTTIGTSGFEGCSGMLAISLGSGLSNISSKAFYGCNVLGIAFYNGTETAWKAVDIAADNEAIDEDIKVDCRTSAVTGASSGEIFWSLDPRTYVMLLTGTGAMADYGTSLSARPWNDYKSVVREVVIENGVTYIGSGAFRQFNEMRTVAISASVTTIGERAFNSCSSLEEVYYGGTSADWAAVTVGSYNTDLTSAKIWYAE